MGPGTKFKTRLQRGDLGINRLDKIAKRHDIAYTKAKSLQDKGNRINAWSKPSPISQEKKHGQNASLN